MAGETDLATLLRSMTPVLQPQVYVFVTVDAVPDGLTPRMIFHEAEGITLIVPREQAQAQGLTGVFDSRMITLNIHSSLDAVGFMAAIASDLARLGMGVNPVAGFYHDHLFVPADRAEDAMQALRALAATA